MKFDAVNHFLLKRHLMPIKPGSRIHAGNSPKYCSSHHFHAHTHKAKGHSRLLFSSRMSDRCRRSPLSLSASLCLSPFTPSASYMLPAAALCSLQRCAANLKDITHCHTPEAVCRGDFVVSVKRAKVRVQGTCRPKFNPATL